MEIKMRYKLLTPGPLTTTDTVKREMMIDHCTWDDDYKSVTQKIRAGLLKLAHVSEEEYTSVLIQGSGTFGVEAAITTLVGEDDYLLILANGAYGERMADIAHHAGISYHMRSWAIDEQPDAQTVKMILQENKSITHVAMVHSETTSGILNDVQSIGRVVKEAGATFIVDAISSFAGVDIPVREWGIDCIISSANKCIQGVPGFAYVIVRKDLLAACEGNARSLALDLYDQWKTMNVDGKWRFTSPTHVVLAFAKAMEELLNIFAIHIRITNRIRNLTGFDQLHLFFHRFCIFCSRSSTDKTDHCSNSLRNIFGRNDVHFLIFCQILCLICCQNNISIIWQNKDILCIHPYLGSLSVRLRSHNPLQDHGKYLPIHLRLLRQ